METPRESELTKDGALPPSSGTAGAEAKEPRASRPRWRRVALEVLVVVGVYFAITAWHERDTLPTDQKAPSFSLPALDGGTVRLEDFAGKTVLLHFWATWCGVCRVEIPTMRSIHEDLNEDQVLLAVVASEDPDEVRGFVKEHGITYPVVFADRKVLQSYGVKAFPTNYVIGSDGHIRGRTVGLSSRLGLWYRMRFASD